MSDDVATSVIIHIDIAVGNDEKGERSSPDGCDIHVHDEDPKKVSSTG